MEDQEYLKLLGQRIADARNAASLTQLELASKCDMEPTNLIRIEKGRTNPTVKTLLKICKALSIELNSLFKF